MKPSKTDRCQTVLKLQKRFYITGKVKLHKILIAIFLFFFSTTAKAQTFNALLATMLNDTLATYTSQIPNIKGMSASVYIPGQGTWTGVAGISHAGNPITTSTKMGIASNTKLFVATIMLKLAENNRLSLDDKLSTWLPNYPNIDPNIKIRQLLNHTSGIADPIFVLPWMDTIKLNPTRVFTPAEVLSWVGPPNFPVGTSWSYSNTNYVLAGMIAQNATGFHISKLIRDSILTPLNINNMFYDVNEPETGIIAHRWWNTIDYHDTSRVSINTAAGCAGALFSTAADMTKWYTALFAGQIINQSSINELTNFVAIDNPNSQYGLGLMRDKTQGYSYWGHGGSTWGYRSRTIYDSCLHVAVCGLSNSFPSGMEAVTFLLYRAVKNHIPGCCGPIAGLTVVTAGTSSVTYSVPPIANATSYIWSLPAGVTGVSNSNSITVDYSINAFAGNISVQGVNNYGPGGSASLWVTVNPFLLPVKLISFTAQKYKEDLAWLRWSTAQEINNIGFEIERSTNAIHFEKIGFVKGNINTSQVSYYFFIDTVPVNSTMYYRLKTTDVNGKNDYSRVIPLRFDLSNKILIYPNPVSDYIFIEPRTDLSKEMTVNFYTSTGSLLRTGRFTQDHLQYDIRNMANGMYVLEIISGTSAVKQLVTIQR
jgi:CubicO group peptidase (beta-lactamase class C family)